MARMKWLAFKSMGESTKMVKVVRMMTPPSTQLAARAWFPWRT